MKKTLMVICVLFLSACVKNPTPQQIDNADYGNLPENYKEIAQNAISNGLLDPSSAQFSNWGQPAKVWRYNRRYSKNHMFGHRVCVEVNAKNRMGGYVGRKLFYVLINNDKVLDVTGSFTAKGVYQNEVRELCGLRAIY